MSWSVDTATMSDLGEVAVKTSTANRHEASRKRKAGKKENT